MAFTAKNYKPDADTQVFGGKVEFKDGVEVEGLPLASTTKAGAVKVAANQAASTASDVAGVVTDLNALLTKLKAAGLMAADA